ncbi:MAG: B12-binding domain-containing radical SAM protein [Planctomycetes bacterium]|nr:B12-binding domain-containing radical SAM protein [Planctomycetota bacterium]
MPKPKIVFINPPYERIAKGYEFVKAVTNNVPSLGLLHLAAEVRLHGYEPSIIESDHFGYDEAKVAELVIKAAPKYVGITLFTVGVWGAAGIARLIKKALPETIIIVGGPHISSMGRETIQRFPEFDYAMVGEGEKILMDLLAAIEGERNFYKVPGLIFRDGGEIRNTPGNAVNKSLDELPFPAWDLLPDFPRRYRPAIYDYPAGPVATIAASRGCPFHCKFCDTSTFGAAVRAYSPAKVFEMMKHLQDTYGVKHIMFVDDLFLASRQRTMALCEMILANKLKMTWTCCARVDTVKPDILDLMKRAGCWEISFGLETGSDELLKAMDKVASVVESENAVRWTAAAGIRTKGLFMLGYPGETAETIELTKAFVKRIPMTMMNLSKFTPYPGSPVYREIYGTNIRDDHWEKMNGMNFVWAAPGLTVEQLDREFQSLLKAFYLHPRVMHQYTMLTLRHPGHFLRSMRFVFGYFGAKLKSLLTGRKGSLLRESAVHLDHLPQKDATPPPKAAEAHVHEEATHTH